MRRAGGPFFDSIHKFQRASKDGGGGQSDVIIVKFDLPISLWERVGKEDMQNKEECPTATLAEELRSCGINCFRTSNGLKENNL